MFIQRIIQLFLFTSILVSSVAFANSTEYYESLEARCQNSESPNCCLASVNAMKRTGSLEVDNNKECPTGFFRNMMKCLSSLAWCEPKKAETNCHNLGIEEKLGSDLQSSTNCCEGLVRRLPKTICGKALPSAYKGGVCLACGNQHCDPGIENTCNCPEDCSN